MQAPQEVLRRALAPGRPGAGRSAGQGLRSRLSPHAVPGHAGLPLPGESLNRLCPGVSILKAGDHTEETSEGARVPRRAWLASHRSCFLELICAPAPCC